MQALPSELPEIAADILDRIRTKRPRVHCITNAVAQTFSANVLLAAGAVPSMTIAPKEIAAFVARADALLVNLGTFDNERQKAAVKAIAVAAKNKTPWVLDPVFIDRSKPRATFAKTLVAKRPAVVRLNAAEFSILSGADAEVLAEYAKSKRTVIGLTGQTDFIHDGRRLVTIANGDPMMARVTAMGCAGAAFVGACLAVEPDAWIATAAALIVFGVAGEMAGLRSRGPGSFAMEIVDALYNLERAAIVQKARVS